ncbi:peptidoglycan-associated lipoprotein Pal [Dongia sp.]|uniref:peptidoglycan-associated lipoprotein Pal n=1 Tax=Dongia sp. TaxID=1977262 RepID=UPI00375187BD
MLRRLPALCAGVLMLAACESGSGDPTITPNEISGRVTPEPPGGGEDISTDEYFRSKAGNNVLFDTDRYALSADGQRTLQRQAIWLQQFPRRTVTIEGHADERGTREYNLALGERRAQAILDYLVALGVDPKRLKTISYGKERPLCTAAEEACWSQNRRGVSTLDP